MKRIISRILFIVIFIECLASNNTLALGAEIDRISLFEREVNKADENISSGAVYIEAAVIDNEYDSIDSYAQSILDKKAARIAACCPECRKSGLLLIEFGKLQHVPAQEKDKQRDRDVGDRQGY